jgi:transcriptional regulator NrdR family protein
MHSAYMESKKKKKQMVKKRNGRLEPFESRKMARATSRAGVPYSIALDIARTIKNDESLARKAQVRSVTLRKIVAEELGRRNQETAANSYLGYKKTQSTKQKFERSRRGKSKARGRTLRTHTKHFAKTKDITGGKHPRRYQRG